MQNRYTGDIGDFGKLGLLRQLSRTGLSLGVNWYLTRDETRNGDGRYIGFLKNDAFRTCDEQLWSVLGQIVDAGKRQVSALERPDILRATFYSRMLELSEYYRAGASVIYYQHKAHRKDEFYIEQNNQLMESGGFSGAKSLALKFRTTSQRYYFFLIQPQHAEAIMRCIEQMISTPWKNHFEIL